MYNINHCCIIVQSGGSSVRVDINSPLSSIWAFSMDLKRIQTSPCLFWDFGADKTFTTCWSGGRVYVWVQVWAPAGHLAIIPEDYSRRQSKVLTAKSMAKVLGQRSGTACQVGRVGRASKVTRCFWVSCSRCWPRLARSRKTCYHSCDTDSVRE